MLPSTSSDRAPGLLILVATACLFGGLARAVDCPRAAFGIHSDEATYYMTGHSLAEDGDLTYRRDDLIRVWREFQSGPSGLFLKRGRAIGKWGVMRRPPFVWTRTAPDPDATRLFYGKSFAYPLAASPFILLFGTKRLSGSSRRAAVTAIGHLFALLVTRPYTWGGGGGSISNRYFIGSYGMLLFLLPPISRTWIGLVPWAGTVFIGSLVLTPFATSIHPGDYRAISACGSSRW